MIIAIVSGFTSLSELAELVNIGTLFAFIVVAIGVVILRNKRPDLPRSFRTPWYRPSRSSRSWPPSG